MGGQGLGQEVCGVGLRGLGLTFEAEVERRCLLEGHGSSKLAIRVCFQGP